jgi:RNA polymerase sigma factor (sigma-70 family)
MTHVRRIPGHRAGDELSSAELLRQCGQKLTDVALWQTFHERFHKRITAYVIRTIAILRHNPDHDLVCDIVQDVYLRLLQNNGRAMSSFREETDFSVFAFLGRMTMRAVSDHFRPQQAGKRSAEIISIDDARRIEEDSRVDDLDISGILSWIDVDRLIQAEPDRRNATRNVLIFKLYYVEGLTVKEISQYPGFDLTESAIEVILKNLRVQLRKKMGR